MYNIESTSVLKTGWSFIYVSDIQIAYDESGNKNELGKTGFLENWSPTNLWGWKIALPEVSWMVIKNVQAFTSFFIANLTNNAI